MRRTTTVQIQVVRPNGHRTIVPLRVTEEGTRGGIFKMKGGLGANPPRRRGR